MVHKTISNAIYKFYLLFFFICLPAVFLQDWAFIIPLDITTPQSYFSLIANYIRSPHTMSFHIIFAACTFLTLFLYIAPISKYLYTQNTSLKARATSLFYNYPLFFIVFICTSLLVLGIYIFLNRSYFSELPAALLLIKLIYRILWSILIGILMVHIFIDFCNSMIKFIPQTHIQKKDVKSLVLLRKLLSRIVIWALIVCTLFIAFYIITAQSINTQNNINIEIIRLIILHSCINIFFIVCLTMFLCFLEKSQYDSMTTKIINHFKNFTRYGLTTDLITFYEKNNYGFFISNLNEFILTLNQETTRIFNKAQQINSHHKDMQQSLQQFSEFINSEIREITEFNLHQTLTLKGIQYLTQKIETQQKNLATVPKIIEVLGAKTQTLMYNFEKVHEENITASELAQSARESTDKAIEKSIFLQTNVTNLQQQIISTTDETAGIDDVLQIIKNIAEQTKLLSMSASIEAAHGGGSSSGFTSVAEEIRKLAELSQDAVDRISGRLDTIETAINNSMLLISNSAESLDNHAYIYESVVQNMRSARNISEQFTHDLASLQDRVLLQQEVVKKYQGFSHMVLTFLQEIHKDLIDDQEHAKSIDIHFSEIYKKITTGMDTIYSIDSLLAKSPSHNFKHKNSYTQIFNSEESYE